MKVKPRDLFPNTIDAVKHFTDSEFGSNYSKLADIIGISRQRAFQLKTKGIITVKGINQFCQACDISFSSFFSYILFGCEPKTKGEYINISTQDLTIALSDFLPKFKHHRNLVNHIFEYTNIPKHSINNILKDSSIVGFFAVIKLMSKNPYGVEFYSIIKSIEKEKYKYWK
jgi:hypothetical protein